MAGVVCIDGREAWCESSREIRACLERWGINNLKMQSFRYVETISDRDDEACVHDLMKSTIALDWLSQFNITGGVHPCNVVPLRTTIVDMDFFDSLQGQPPAPISSNGNARPCAEKYFEGVLIHDELRKLLVRIERKTNVDGTQAHEEDDDDDDEEEIAATLEAVGESATTEFIFHLFSLLAIGGGSMCQPDDTVDAYLSTTKSLYRHLLTVCRPVASGNDIVITTKAYRVYGSHLFNSKNRLQRCYVLLDRKARVTTILYNAVSSW